MTSTLTAPAADLLMVGPLLPELTADLESRYRVHRWWETVSYTHLTQPTILLV